MECADVCQLIHVSVSRCGPACVYLTGKIVKAIASSEVDQFSLADKLKNPVTAAVRFRPAALKAPPVFLVPALLVGAALLLPPVYLVVRSLGGGSELWDLLFRAKVAAILGRTLLLVVAVSAGSVVIALPLAWLTARTDLPLRRTWAVLTSLPLVIPSYVAGFVVVVALGPRGMLQGALEGPFGVERLPSIYGFAGAMLTLTLLSYPYVFLTIRAALERMDPALEESARGLGPGTRRHLFPRGYSPASARYRHRSAPRWAVHPERFRRGLAVAV